MLSAITTEGKVSTAFCMQKRKRETTQNALIAIKEIEFLFNKTKERPSRTR